MQELSSQNVAAVGHHAPPNDRPEPREWVCPLDDAAELLAAMSDVSLDHARAHAAARQVAPGGDWLTSLARICQAVGMRATMLDLSARIVATAEQRRTLPMVSVGLDGPFMVTGRSGQRIFVRSLTGDRGTRTASVEELAHMMNGGDVDAPGRWLVAAPASPLDSLSRHGQGHGHEGGHDGGHDGHPSAADRVRALLRLERDDIWVVVVYACAVGLLSLATPIAVQALVNTVAFGALMQPVVVLTLIVMAVLSFAAVLRATQVRFVELIQRRIFVRVAVDIAHRMPRVDATAFDRSYGPELVNRFFDVLTVQKSAAGLLLDGLGLVLQAGIGLLVLAFYHPALLALDASLIVAAVVIIVVLGRRGPDTSIEESKSKYAVAAWLEEIARHPHAFRSTAGAEWATDHADALVRRYLDARRGHFKVVYRQVVGSLTLQVLASAALLGVGGALVISRQLTLGQLVAAEIIVTSVVASFAKLGKHLETWYDLLAAADKLGHLADLPLEHRGGDAAFSNAPRGASLRLRAVNYAYESGATALRGLDFAIAPGARAVVTGPSSAGKSTLASLLFALRLPTSGSVEIDGVDTRDASPEALRDRVAVVGCVVEAINGTILENISAGRAEISRSDAWLALAAVGLEEHVRALPKGLDTPVAPTGAPLSHGEALRLMLARAVAARPRLLVVDGTLDGMDARSRAAVEASLFAPSAPWTLVVLTSPADPVARRADVVIPLASTTPVAPEVAR